MKKSIPRQSYMLFLLLLTLPLLGGAKCAFWFSSGDSDRDKRPPEEPKETVKAGEVGDAPIEGLRYVSGTLSGITGPTGNFEYEAGGNIRLFLGDISLGEAVLGKALISPPDLIPGADYNTPAVINMARLLLSLDSVQGDQSITIPPSVHEATRRDNELVAASIDHLDFSDEAAFVNAASQLVAVLTSEYPFTAYLIGTEPAREYLQQASQNRVEGECDGGDAVRGPLCDQDVRQVKHRQ